jgi:hypothetical protein
MNDTLATNALSTNSLLEVLRLKLAVLIIAVGLFDRDSHNVEDVGRLLEDGIHFLQGTVAGFGEEEVYSREHKEVAVIELVKSWAGIRLVWW